MQEDRLKILLDYLENEPDVPFNIYAVAMEYLKSDRQKSLKLLEKLLVEFPDYLPTYYQLGDLYVGFSEFEKAKTIYENGIEVAKQQNKINTLKELKGAFNILLDEIEE